MPHASRILKADRGDAGRRLDLVICRHLAGDEPSRTRIQEWIKDGRVAVNGAPITRASARASLGDVIEVPESPTPGRAPMAPEEAPLTILYEDPHLIALDKPAGLVVHPTYRHERGTLMNALLWRARSWPPGFRPSIVGRLDKLTSGIVIAAKNATAHAALQRVLAVSSRAGRSGSAEKDYLAVVYGRVNAARGEIDLRLSRDPRDRRRVVASATTGAPSGTRFERLARVAAPKVGLSLVRCRLLTGRMHQIRVHLAARGWPVVGDSKYGEALWSHVIDPELASTLHAFPRQALHAARVAFRHPVTGAPLTIESPIPRDLDDLLTAVGFRM
jgi:23S rRNA pseudouridine1911/1915/1917 synthase